MMRLTGPWAEAAAITQRMQTRFVEGMVQATLKEAHHLRGQMIKGITSQAPGGLAFRPLSPATLAIRQAMGFGGSKALIRTGALLVNISVMRLPGASPKVFIGVLRQAKTKEGKPLANIAAMNEFGATIRKTDRMRRFLMAKLRAAGIKPSGAGGRGGGGGSIVIPARPFVRPVIQRYAKPADVKRRFYQNIADAMGGDFGRVAGARM